MMQQDYFTMLLATKSIYLVAFLSFLGPPHYVLGINCLVCTNDPKVKSLHADQCLNPSAEMLKVAGNKYAWDCDYYNGNMTDALSNPAQSYVSAARVAEGKGAAAGATLDTNKCTVFEVCRSYYYKSDQEYQHFDGKKEPKMEGKNERVFRFCGCTTNSAPQEKLNGKDKKCTDIQKGGTRKRMCVCDPTKSKPGLVCNSANKLQMGFHLILANPVILVVFALLLMGSTWIFDGVAPA